MEGGRITSTSYELPIAGYQLSIAGKQLTVNRYHLSVSQLRDISCRLKESLGVEPMHLALKGRSPLGTREP